ncbi:hypothetical protein ES332_A01G111600v1 [Gossypium tomentosum]|uniref:Secreted protein n=1 Tax=Gossypium tomentosum TaxID=34277 RepID=A0A5D2RQ29_GOSTO|nr:hypothetical protein ES332_A01G111600v1 [Gossypium tomentosum]
MNACSTEHWKFMCGVLFIIMEGTLKGLLPQESCQIQKNNSQILSSHDNRMGWTRILAIKKDGRSSIFYKQGNRITLQPNSTITSTTSWYCVMLH